MTTTQPTWKVTFRTATDTWSTITLSAATHEDAIRDGQRLVGGTFVSVV